MFTGSQVSYGAEGTSGAWEISLGGVRLGNKSVIPDTDEPKSYVAGLDKRSGDITLEKSLFDNVAKALGGNVGSKRSLIVDCDAAHELEFTFGKDHYVVNSTQ